MEEYTSVLDSLSEEYNNKFRDFEKHNLNLLLNHQPRVMNVNRVPDHLQMGLNELLESNILTSLFEGRKDQIEL